MSTGSHRTNPSTSSSIHSRTSSTKSGMKPNANPQVESAVTRLLVSIKLLLESLTEWSTGKVDEKGVSDVYVQLGNDFNTCVLAFSAYEIDMRELRGVPDELRGVLETCLSDDANPETLERYLPQVRQIITDLLTGLRSKQSQFRAFALERREHRRDRGSGSSSQRSLGLGRSSSRPRPVQADIPEEGDRATPTPPSPPPLPSQPPPGVVASAVPERVMGRRKPSGGTRAQILDGQAGPGPSTTARTVSSSSSATNGDGLADLYASASAAEERLRSPNTRQTTLPTSSSSERDDPFEMPQFPQPPPPPPARASPPMHIQMPAVSPDIKRWSLSDRPISPTPAGPSLNFTAASPSTPVSSISQTLSSAADDVPPSPAAEKSLVALQQSDALARKASKRYSSFTIGKMVGVPPTSGSGAGIGVGLPKQSSSKPSHRRSIAPATSISQMQTSELEALAESDEPISPRKQSEDLRAEFRRGMAVRTPSPSEPIRPPIPEGPHPKGPRGPHTEPRSRPVSGQLDLDSPAPKLRSLFLQVGRHVKKVVLDPETKLSFSSLRVLFVDRFSYNPGQDNFPSIYIKDPGSGVQYELEDVDEVRDGCLLSLNIEPLDQIKQHIDLQMLTLSNEIKDLKTAVNSQKRQSFQPALAIETSPATPQQQLRPTDQQFNQFARRLTPHRPDASKSPNGFRPAMQPLIEQPTGGMFTPLAPQTTGGSSFTMTSESASTARIFNDLKTQFDEVQNLRRDLGMMRQVYVEFINQTKQSLGSLRLQTSTVKELANAKVGGARSYIESGKSSLDTRTQTVLTKLESLQDMVEGLKEDVLKRQMNPNAVFLKKLTTDIPATRKELEALQDHIATIKPMWKKTWEDELQNVIEEQQFLSHQEEFIKDLVEDQIALAEVFGHVEKIVSIRKTASGNTPGRIGLRGRSYRPLPSDSGPDEKNMVMVEIRNAAIDPERRLKAIEANQKARHKELNARSNEFEDELGEFVGQKKLKKTGGVEETERLRQARSDYLLKNMFAPATPDNLSVSPSTPSGKGPGSGGSGSGTGGITFAKAPAGNLDELEYDDADRTFSGSNGFGFSGFSFSKAPPE